MHCLSLPLFSSVISGSQFHEEEAQESVRMNVEINKNKITSNHFHRDFAMQEHPLPEDRLYAVVSFS